MGAPRLWSGLLAALVASCAAAAAGMTLGVLNLDLVFPLNETYAPIDGPLPIAFALSSSPFQPGLASLLQLRLNYILLDNHDEPVVWASGDFDVGELSSSGATNPYFFFNYIAAVAGRESQFSLQCTITLESGSVSTDSNSSSATVFSSTLITDAYFTTQSGAQAAVVPASNGSETCLPHAGWNLEFDVSGYVQNGSETYAVLQYASPSYDPLPCAVEVNNATAASIAAGPAKTTTAVPSSAGTAANTADALSGPGIAAAVWSLLVLGLSGMLFAW